MRPSGLTWRLEKPPADKTQLEPREREANFVKRINRAGGTKRLAGVLSSTLARRRERKAVRVDSP